MFCIKCHTKKLQVINSRSQTKHAQIWRRRKCLQCGYIFTTYETIATDHLKVATETQETDFSDITLSLSIARCFEHKPDKRAEYAKWLTNTIVQSLIKEKGEKFTRKELITQTYTTLHNFDRLASIQYAARHTDILKRQLKS